MSIALVFASDFILGPLQAGGLGKYPLTHLPFALMLVGGAGLRVAAFWDLSSNGTETPIQPSSLA